jgi:hypothetical protein
MQHVERGWRAEPRSRVQDLPRDCTAAFHYPLHRVGCHEIRITVEHMPKFVANPERQCVTVNVVPQIFSATRGLEHTNAVRDTSAIIVPTGRKASAKLADPHRIVNEALHLKTEHSSRMQAVANGVGQTFCLAGASGRHSDRPRDVAIMDRTQVSVAQDSGGRGAAVGRRQQCATVRRTTAAWTEVVNPAVCAESADGGVGGSSIEEATQPERGRRGQPCIEAVGSAIDRPPDRTVDGGGLMLHELGQPRQALARPSQRSTFRRTVIRSREFDPPGQL